jgi:hypothetical protein
MTENDKYEIATLASELERKRLNYQSLAIMNTPIDLIAREKAAIEFAIAETEFLEASAALHLAQMRISSKNPTAPK